MRHQKRTNSHQTEVDNKFIEGLKKYDQPLYEAWQKRQNAISKLVLLRADSVVLQVEKFKELEEELRGSIIFERQLMSRDEYEKYTIRVKETYDSLNILLADFFNELTSE